MDGLTHGKETKIHNLLTSCITFIDFFLPCSSIVADKYSENSFKWHSVDDFNKKFIFCVLEEIYFKIWLSLTFVNFIIRHYRGLTVLEIPSCSAYRCDVEWKKRVLCNDFIPRSKLLVKPQLIEIISSEDLEWTFETVSLTFPLFLLFVSVIF